MTFKKRQILTTIAAIAILAGAYVWAIKYLKPQEHHAQTLTPDQTANWKTYKNDKYGFEVRYPTTWPITTSKTGRDNRIFVLAINHVEPTSDGGGLPKYLYISIEPGENIYSCVGGRKEPLGYIVIDGNQYEKCINPGSYFNQGDGLYVTLIHSGFTYVFSADFYDKNHTTVDQILSTFKFTKDETTDWKTYSNGKYGFELSYPGNWSINTPTGTKTALYLSFRTADRAAESGELAALNVYISEQDLKDSYGFVLDKRPSPLQIVEISGLPVSVQEASVKDNWQSSVLFFFNKNGVYYVLGGSAQVRDDLLKVLSSFKFTK